MKTLTFFTLFSLLTMMPPRAARAQDKIPLTSSTVVQFASVEQARVFLSTRDEYIAGMSPFDRQLRLKTGRSVSEAEVLKLDGASAIAWNAVEKANIMRAIDAIRPRLAELDLPLPRTVLLIETDGSEEDNLAYTRSNAIVLPRRMILMGGLTNSLNNLVTHELFHVMSRNNPKLRPALYGCIGFVACDDIELPGELKARKISNPDEVKNDFYCTVEFKGKKVDVVPVIFSQDADYKPETGAGIMGSMVLKLMAIEKREGRWQAALTEGKPLLIDFSEVTGLYEKIGRNTNYVIGPEETMADNFEIMVSGRKDVPSPQIIEALRGVLAKKKDK